LAEVPLPAPLDSDVYARDEVVAAAEEKEKEVKAAAPVTSGSSGSSGSSISSGSSSSGSVAATANGPGAIDAVKSAVSSFVKVVRERLQLIVNVAYTSVLVYFIFMY
jgi:hypothetical protein